MAHTYRSQVFLAHAVVRLALSLAGGIFFVAYKPAVDIINLLLALTFIGFSAFLAAAGVTSMVRLTPTGVVHRRRFRSQTVPWDSIESFSVAPIPETPAWSAVLVGLRPAGYLYLTSASGSKRYIRRLIADFEGYRAKLGYQAEQG
jgi:hypothetical protein